MALYTISDLHLPLGVDKPMNIFGKRWENYVERLAENWRVTVGEEDTVVMPGDFSWATYLEQAKADFDFLESLPGRKIISKGNHDYWWTTMNKLREFAAENGYKSVEFMHNNCYMYENTAICGTRGWIIPPLVGAKQEDIKMYNRELIRLENSIIDAERKNPDDIIVFMHYPPLLSERRDTEFTRLLRERGVRRCVYGHIHSNGVRQAVRGWVRGVEYILAAADYSEFMPIKLKD